MFHGKCGNRPQPEVNQPYFSCAHISQSAHARDEGAGKIQNLPGSKNRKGMLRPK